MYNMVAYLIFARYLISYLDITDSVLSQFLTVQYVENKFGVHYVYSFTVPFSPYSISRNIVRSIMKFNLYLHDHHTTVQLLN